MRRAALLLTAVLACCLASAAAAPAQVPEPTPVIDTTPPSLVRAVATSDSTIDVEPSEPVDPFSIQPADFAVQIAGVNRTIDGATANGDGTRITLHSPDTWEPAEAGIMRLSGPGVISDRAGNPSGEPADVRVGAAPGDFVAPTITNFRLNPNRGVCFVVGPRCKQERTAIIFRSSEDGDTYITVFRGSRLIGERRYTGQPGENYIRFDGKILGRRIRPGLYRMYVAVQDEVGNRLQLDRQPHADFRVKSTKAPPKKKKRKRGG
jgi:hypothetical protein